jgi:CRP/FNR family transcriptional regulator, anaerobic regulatory protein
MRHGAIGARDDHFDRGSVMSSIVKLASHRGPAAAGTGQAFLSPHGRMEKDEHLSLDAVFEGAAVESVASGRTLFWEGDKAEHIVKISEGLLRICRILHDGRRAIAGFASAGDVLGLSFKDRYLFSAEAITPVKVMKITRRQLDAFLHDWPCGPQLVCDHVRDELCAAQDQMMILVHQCAEARLAGFLCQMARKLTGDLSAGVEFDLAMPRADIADHLGLTMETVCRSMTRLRKTGYIGMKGAHRIRLSNPSKLIALAGTVDGVTDGRVRA